MEKKSFSLKDKKIYIVFCLLQILLIGISFTSGYFLRDRLFYNPNQFPIMLQVFNILKDYGIKEMPSFKSIEYEMIKSMISVYDDPYTTFIEPPQAELQTNQLEGKFGGIGARIEYDEQKNVFLFPFPDSPAAIAGIMDGDKLIAIDDLKISEDTSMESILAAIRGPVGDKVRITIIQSPGYKNIITYTIKREEISVPSTTSNLIPYETRIGIVHINVIAETTPVEVVSAISDLQMQGATYFILDLRNNSGGLVDAGVSTAALFLKSGTIIEQQYKNQSIKKFTVEKTGPYFDLPIVIFVNRGTASAAEIVAGSLQNHKRGKLIGYPTYGKDSIQLIFDLQDNSSLHVTSAHWWIPGLKFPEENFGLSPDILLAENDAEDIIYIRKAMEYFIEY